jgi:hypothetical protein
MSSSRSSTGSSQTPPRYVYNSATSSWVDLRFNKLGSAGEVIPRTQADSNYRNGYYYQGKIYNNPSALNLAITKSEEVQTFRSSVGEAYRQKFQKLEDSGYFNKVSVLNEAELPKQSQADIDFITGGFKRAGYDVKGIAFDESKAKYEPIIPIPKDTAVGSVLYATAPLWSSSKFLGIGDTKENAWKNFESDLTFSAMNKQPVNLVQPYSALGIASALIPSFVIGSGLGFVTKSALGVTTSLFPKATQSVVSFALKNPTATKTIVAGISTLAVGIPEGIKQYSIYTGMTAQGSSKSEIYTTMAGELSRDAVGVLGSIAGFKFGYGANTWLQTKAQNAKVAKQVKILPLAQPKETSFLRKGQETVMRRYEGFKLTDAKTWGQALKGTKKGSFTQRAYRLIEPEVQTFYMTGGKKGHAFPTDKTSTHLDWFKYGSEKNFYLPKGNLKDIELKVISYSATDNPYSNLNIYPKTGAFYSGRGVSIGFARLGVGTAESGSSGFAEMLLNKKPVVYAGYVNPKDIVINIAK